MQDVLDNVGDEFVSGSAPARKSHVRTHQVFRTQDPDPVLPSDIRSLLDEDDASVWIKEGLKKIDLGSVRALFKESGGVPYDPMPMLGILLLSYMEGETGTRTIEKRCRRDIAYMYVADGFRPDYRTIGRFRLRVAPVLEDVFQRVVLACKEEKLLPMRRVAVDGTKMASAASQMARWLKKSEKEDLEEMGLEPPESSDPEARNVGSSGKFVYGYNAQAAVDCDSGIVVAVALDNINSDGHQLAPMAQKVVHNTGSPPEEFVADAGYDTQEGACVCAELGSVPILAPHDQNATFWTVTQDDKILCPMGHELFPLGSPRKGENGKMYQTLKPKACSSCPLVKSCGSQGRSLSHPVGVSPIPRLNAAFNARSPEGKQAMRERMATIETVFADVKWNKGLKRFKLRGLQGARTEWMLIHIARNIAKLGKALKLALLALLNDFLGRISMQKCSPAY